MGIKEHLYQYCVDWVNEKITLAEQGMKQSQMAANEEQKSSAGDKYETGRAMMHLEKEKLAVQLAAAHKLKKVLHEINPKHRTDKVTLGALVETSIGKFYLSISAGKINLADEAYIVVSLGSPIGQALNQKSAGDRVIFNQKTIEIMAVN